MQKKRQTQHSEGKISSEDRELVELVKQSEPNLAKKLKDIEIVRFTRIISSVSYYNGPLPPPNLLREFNQIIPNGAERIIKQFEEQSFYRREFEKLVIRSQQTRSNIGQWLGFSLALICIVSSLYLASKGHTEDVVSIIGGSTVISLAAIFVVGRLMQNKKLKEKNE
jgi:uncharacterized membrane protein